MNQLLEFPLFKPKSLNHECSMRPSFYNSTFFVICGQPASLPLQAGMFVGSQIEPDSKPSKRAEVLWQQQRPVWFRKPRRRPPRSRDAARGLLYAVGQHPQQAPDTVRVHRWHGGLYQYWTRQAQKSAAAGGPSVGCMLMRILPVSCRLSLLSIFIRHFLLWMGWIELSEVHLKQSTWTHWTSVLRTSFALQYHYSQHQFNWAVLHGPCWSCENMTWCRPLWRSFTRLFAEIFGMSSSKYWSTLVLAMDLWSCWHVDNGILCTEAIVCFFAAGISNVSRDIYPRVCRSDFWNIWHESEKRGRTREKQHHLHLGESIMLVVLFDSCVPCTFFGCFVKLFLVEKGNTLATPFKSYR